MSSEENNREDYFSLFDTIQKVDPPPYLLTGIKQKILERKEQKVTPVFALGLSLGLSLIILLNVTLVLKNNKNQVSGLAAMEIVNDNSLYQ